MAEMHSFPFAEVSVTFVAVANFAAPGVASRPGLGPLFSRAQEVSTLSKERVYLAAGHHGVRNNPPARTCVWPSRHQVRLRIRGTQMIPYR